MDSKFTVGKEDFMSLLRNLIFCILLFVVFIAGGFAQAADLSGAQGTVNNIRQADPPQVSTTTKSSPVGEPVSWYKPSGPSPTITEPPSPVDSNNPQNDPDVQAGYDAHQDWYNSK